MSKTLDGIVTTWNAAAERMFGYPACEMIGRSIRRLIPPDRQHEEDNILASLARGEGIEHYETVRVAKDGRLLEVSLSLSPLRDHSGHIIGASKIVRDITPRKQGGAKLIYWISRTMQFLRGRSAGASPTGVGARLRYTAIRPRRRSGKAVTSCSRPVTPSPWRRSKRRLAAM